jgi:beta-glucosidase-like glycosyl hydrolase
MDLLKAVALSAALAAPAIAGLQDLNAPDSPAPNKVTASLKHFDSAQTPGKRLAGPAATIQADAKPDAIQPHDARL